MPWSPHAVILRDLVLGAFGTIAFLLDLGTDLWVAVQYVLGGHYLWAVLLLALLCLASVVLQLFSWIWLRGDSVQMQGVEPPSRRLALLHVLQLGYLYRCLQGLHQGLQMWRQKTPSDFEYADCLSLDISMLRLFETFLEATPQLTLQLAIVLQIGQVKPFQWISICASFLGISWALLDYHRALRTCLSSKSRLGLGSSVVYFLWNLLLLWPRVLAVALFSALFPCSVALHFLFLWVVLLIWVWLQGTDFMPDPRSEWLYRATVAVILYFSWFNVAEGSTRGRATIHLAFVLSDSVLLVITWVTHRTWLPGGIPLYIWLLVSGVSFLLGLALRLAYYSWLHPSYSQKPDRVDGTRSLLAPEPNQVLHNRRMTQLARNFFSKAKDEAASPGRVEVNGTL